MVPVHNGWLWFPKSPGLVSGIVIGGFALSALIFDNLARYLINPENLETDDPNYEQVIRENFVYMLRFLWFCFLYLAIIGLVNIWKGPKKQAPSIRDFAANASLIAAEMKAEDDDPSLRATLKEMLFSKTFILLYVMNSMSVFTGFFVVNQTVNYG